MVAMASSNVLCGIIIWSIVVLLSGFFMGRCCRPAPRQTERVEFDQCFATETKRVVEPVFRVPADRAPTLEAGQ